MNPKFNARGGINRQSNKEKKGLVASGTTVTGSNQIQPSISANDLVNPPAPINPPAPTVNLNDGSRTQNLVDNVSANNQEFIKAQSAEQTKADELAKLLGEQTSAGAEQRTQLGQQFGLPETLARRTDIQTQLTKANTESDVTKERIKGAAGQTLGQAGREITQEDRENAVRTAGLAAEAAVLQGSIETASTLINQAMSDYYSDRQINNQNMTKQLEYFSGIADKQTKQLLDNEARKYKEDQDKITRVVDTVDEAMASGSASVEDMRKLTDPKTTDDERLTIAQGVIARGAGEARGLDVRKQEASIKASEASIRASNANAALNEQKLLDVEAKNQLIKDAVASGKVILSPDQEDRAAKISKEFEDEAGEFKKQVGAYNRIIASAEDPSAAGDVAVVFNYMKMLDPGSVVRESEFALAASTGSLKEAMKNKFGKIATGEILEFTRDDFVDRASKLYFASLDQQVELEDRFRKQSTELFNLPPEAAELIVQDIRATGAVSDVAFSAQLNSASDEQLLELQKAGLMPNSTVNQQ